MRKYIVLLILPLLLNACMVSEKPNENESNNNIPNLDIIQIAYDNIGEEQKKEILDWENANISKFESSEELLLYNPDKEDNRVNIQNIPTYRIIFETGNGVLGPIVVFLEYPTLEFLGIGFRD